MRVLRIILVLLMLLFVAGCFSTTVNGKPRKVLFVQRGVMLTVMNFCTPNARLFQSGRGVVVDSLAFGEPVNVPLLPPSLVGGIRDVEVIFQAYSADWKVLRGVAVARFRIDSQGTRTETWIVGGSGRSVSSRTGQNACRE